MEIAAEMRAIVRDACVRAVSVGSRVKNERTMRLTVQASQMSRERRTGSSLARTVNDGEVDRWRGSRDRGVARPEAGECALMESGKSAESARQQRAVMAQECSADGAHDGQRVVLRSATAKDGAMSSRVVLSCRIRAVE